MLCTYNLHHTYKYAGWACSRCDLQPLAGPRPAAAGRCASARPLAASCSRRMDALAAESCGCRIRRRPLSQPRQLDRTGYGRELHLLPLANPARGRRWKGEVSLGGEMSLRGGNASLPPSFGQQEARAVADLSPHARAAGRAKAYWWTLCGSSARGAVRAEQCARSGARCERSGARCARSDAHERCAVRVAR